MMMVTGRSGQAANAAVLAKARPAPIAKRRAEESREERRLKLSRFMVRKCWKIESPNINNLLSKPRLIIFCLLIFKSNIGIGGSSDELRPCHTTRHAGPHRAVREVEVKRASERLVYRSGLRARRHSRRGRYCSTSAGSLPPRIERQRSEPQGRATPGTSSCLASIA